MVDRGLLDDHQGTASHPIPDYRIPTREGSRVLPKGFVPGEWDVICHSSQDTHDHIGNRRFDLCVENHIEAYKKAKSRVAKSAVISDIVGSIRESSTTGGGFVRYDIGIERWYEVGDKVARDKVGQSLRVHNSNRKKTSRRLSPLLGEVMPSLKPSPISSFVVSAKMERALTAQSIGNTASTVPQPPEESTSPIDDSMMRAQLQGIQDGKQKSNDDSDDNSLLAWFEADARGIIK